MIDIDIEQQLGTFHLAVAFAADAPIVGLFGRSGAGKSSVVNAIAGITTPARGHVRINDVTLFDARQDIDLPPEQRRIGYVFQDALLFPHMDVEANLLYGQNRRPARERFIEQGRVIELLGLGTLLHRKPRMLSGGEKQRVAIGRALLAQPRVLLMDEPLAALDMSRKTEILAYIERLRDQLAIPIVYVSHSGAEIARLADTVVVLGDGKCLAVGEAEDVLGRSELKVATGRYEPGSLVETRVSAHDVADELTTLSFDGGEFLVPRLEAPIGERVRAQIRARDVSLAVQRPAGISILNVMPGQVSKIEAREGAVVNVEVAVGRTLLNASITRRSMQRLDVRVGQPIYALVKAVSFDQRSANYATGSEEP